MPMRAVLVVATFTLIMAGPNLPTALLPGYRQSLGLGALGLTVLFGTYLFALVATLLTARWPAARCAPRALVLVALALAIGSDAVLALTPTLAGVLSGRVLSGLSVGLATGAVAVLLGRHGTPGAGSLTALCALLGSAAGTALTAVLAQELPASGVLAPGRSGYGVHGVLCLAAGLGVLAVPALTEPRRAEPGRGAGPLLRPGWRARFAVAVGVGVASWMTAGIVVGLLPSYTTSLLHTANLVLASAGVVGFLLAASASSLAAGRRGPRTELVAAPVGMAAGLVIVAGAGSLAATHPTTATTLLVLGAAVAGAGMGLGFRSGLVTALAAAETARTSTATSVYSAGAYLGAAVTTLALGMLASAIGLLGAVAVAAAVLLVGAGVLVGAVRRGFPVPAASPESAGPTEPVGGVAGAVTTPSPARLRGPSR